MKRLWAWLRDDKNRDILTKTGAGLATLVAAVWAVMIFIVDHHPSASVTAEPGGIAAGRDISGNTITFPPPAAGLSVPAAPAAKSP